MLKKGREGSFEALLTVLVKACADGHEYEMYRQDGILPIGPSIAIDMERVAERGLAAHRGGVCARR